jgi:MFS family permease
MDMTSGSALKAPASSPRKMLVPLALAQFICSFAGSNMNVMISDISRDLHTTTQGVQVCITLFLLVMAALMVPCGKLTDRFGRKRLFQLGLLVYGAGAIGLVVLVGGVMAADKNVALMAVLLVAGALILAGFFTWIRRRERAGKEALLSTGLFRNRTSNLAMVTQNVQWQLLMGASFVVSVYLQTVRHYSSIQTGVIFTAATVGILLSSLAAGRLVKQFQQRTLILAGFVITIIGIVVLLVQVKGHPGAWYFAPGLFLIGGGCGTMLTPSVNVVQSAFPENLQGEISGLSRSVSNLGSSIGTAIAGTILVAGLSDGQRSYGIAMAVLAFIGLLGLGATVMLPKTEPSPGADALTPRTAASR